MVRIPARRYRRALAEHLCERAAALRSRGEVGVRITEQSSLTAAICPRLPLLMGLTSGLC